MSDLCFIYNNLVDSASSILADSTLGSTSVENLKSDNKGKIHRSYAGSVVYDINWTVGQTIDAIALPATNLPSDATIQVWADSIEIVEPTAIFGYTDINATGYVGSATANEFGVGRYTSGYVLLDTPETGVNNLEIRLVSSSGIPIDCSRIVVGNTWRPNRQANRGIKIEKEDTSKVTKLNTGNMVFDRGYQFDTLAFTMQYFDDTDRENLLKILKYVGNYKNIFVTVFPSLGNRLIQDYSIYGRITKSPIMYDVYGYYSYDVKIESW